MSDNLPYCHIQGNADIAGVGIRASLYIQACLGPLFFLFLYVAGSVPKETMGKQGTIARDLALKRCKLLDEISLALLLTGTALITSTVIEAKTTDSGLSPYHTLIVLNLSWLNNVTGFTLRLWSCLIKTANQVPNLEAIIRFVRTCWAFTLHCFIMSIVGIWFWADPNSFSRITDDHPCIPITYFWLFSRIPLPNDKLRIFSLIAYSAISIPIVNIIIHLVPWMLLLLVPAVIHSKAIEKWIILPWVLSFLTVVMGPTVFFIYSTEMLIIANADFVDHDVEEKWTFGQTLALFLAAVSVFLVMGHIRQQRRETRNAKMEKSGIGISKGAGGIAMMMLATQGQRYKARDVGPQILTPDELTPHGRIFKARDGEPKILTPDEESLGFSW